MVNYLSFDISAEKTHKGTAFLSNKQTFVRNLYALPIRCLSVNRFVKLFNNQPHLIGQ